MQDNRVTTVSEVMEQPPLDPLRRVFVPRESEHGYLSTTDGEQYRRDRTGAIRAVNQKARGKSARRAEKEARRALKARRR